ncbi:acetyl-CoA synthetase-like protein [Mycena vulgaris]|nr:acetyl-CoA synthetase-like protein [Mycena vulgaris]
MSIPLAFLRTHPPLPPSLSLGELLTDALSRANITTLLDCLASTTAPAIHSPDPGRRPLLHWEVKQFVQDFVLPHSANHAALGPNDRVLLVLPTGPESALAFLAVASYYTCAPVNSDCTAAELRDEAQRLNAKAVVATRHTKDRLQLRVLGEELGCDVVLVEPRASGPCAIFNMSVMGDVAPLRNALSRLNGLQDRSLILHTSGTSGRKKVVPYTLFSLVVGTCCVVESWDLKPTDLNFNMMPLFHVGGIVRNLLAPLFSGGSTIVGAGFDPVAFWTLAERLQPTWYYAAPTMHHAILASKPDSIVPAMNLSIRMICNAAGGLLPALALDLQTTFQAVILPSYGMTECMPITSPSPTYRLDRPGCSGIACGPYLSIRDPANIENALAAEKTGAICVRGLPTFQGYEVSPDVNFPLDTSAFTSEGWFDSGDMGHIDGDGYLFVTGRSKEIINRGGEVISPFEVEEAIMDVAKQYTTLAFGIEHEVLQETVGVVVVPLAGRPRIGLGQLQDLLQDHLHTSKWPIAVVYMEDLPKNSAGKALRINLASRLGIGCLSDSVSALHRHFEADVPDTLAPLSEPIGCHRVTLDVTLIERTVLAIPGVQEVAVHCREDGSPEAFISASGWSSQELKESISGVLAGYAIPVPLHVLRGKLHKSAAGEMDFSSMEAEAAKLNTSALSETALLLRDVLGNISSDSDFFLLGGNSLLLGKLAYQIRKNTGVDIPVTTLFRHTTINEIVSLIDASDDNLPDDLGSCMDGDMPSQNQHEDTSNPANRHSLNQSDPALCNEPFEVSNLARSQTHPLCFIIQSIPFVLFYPLKAALTWTILLLTLAELAPNINGNLWKCFFIAIVVAKLLTGIISPIASILFKWIVIGTYKPGKHRMWSGYYLRFWIVNQALCIAGRGIFGIHPALHVMYYRLLGVSIGKNVTIDRHAILGEFDLLTFGDGCVIDNAVIRGFCVEREGFFTLDTVTIGRYAVINTYTQISPGAIIPDGAVYGPHASSRDSPSPEGFAAYNRKRIPEPHLLLKLFVAWPIIFSSFFVSYLPWFTIIFWIMATDATNIIERYTDPFKALVSWFATPERVLYHVVLSRMIRVVITPLIQLALGILIKRAFGFNKETSPDSRPTQIVLLRRYINSYTLSKFVLKTAFSILGTHYEAVSIVYRAMGAKIGRRIYWPNSGIFCLDPELLEIGDDVVFGSRSEVLTTDCIGTAKIVVGDGAMIADRVVLLPGTKIGKLTLMGSGTLAVRSKEYKDGSIWLGKDCLDDGSRRDLGHDIDTSTPFGRAFYQHKAPYTVYPYVLILATNIAVIALSATYWSIGASSAAQVLCRLNLPDRLSWVTLATVYGINSLCFVVVLNIQAILAIVWVIATKWVVIGQRQEGRYAWDQNSYCQRWQLHLVFSRFISKGYGNRGVLAPLTGTVYLVWYLRALGAKIGKDCAIYPGGKMGLMTEPDLVELGDNVSLDDCSVVAHINSRGNFALNSLNIGNGCAMRSGSRLLSGASMEDSSMLCEHTLLASGDVADSGAVYSEWPAKQIAGPSMRKHTRNSRRT